MNNVFSEIGINAVDFVQISATFFLTMLIFFAVKNKRYRWLNMLCLITLILQCLLFILFREGLTVKFFAILMLTTTLIVEVTVKKLRKQNGNLLQ